MDQDDQFLTQILSAIVEADVISIFFPLLRRALVIDMRESGENRPVIQIMGQANSMEERIVSIEKLRPNLGKIRSILGVPWLKSVRSVEEAGILDSLVDRLSAAGMHPAESRPALRRAINQLWNIERLAFVGLIQGEGYKTLWTSKQS
ncbi:MAG: hypothetical protein ABI670_08380 [Chloroflexota bacterium]